MGSDSNAMIQNVSSAKSGNKEAFDALIHINKLALYKVAKGILISDDDVNDAIQEAIIKAYVNLNTLKNDAFFKTWIIRILINECKGILKKNKKHALNKNMYFSEPSVADHYPSDSNLTYYLSHLDESLKYVVILYYCNDMKVEEISQILKIPAGTVKSRLARARKQLKGIIKEEESL